MLDRSLNVHFTAPSSNTMPRTSDGLPLSAFTLGLGFDGDSMTRDLVREGTTTASGRIDEGFGGVSRGHPSRSNGGLGAVWRGIGPPELTGISSTPADTPSARALRLVRWVVCWPRFKINRLPWKASRGESGRATSDFTSPLVRIWLEISREFWPGVVPSVVTAGRGASGFTRTPHSREEGGASHSRLVRTFDFSALSRSSSSRASNPPRITDSEHLPAI